jgi:hypothetical protein
LGKVWKKGNTKSPTENNLRARNRKRRVKGQFPVGDKIELCDEKEKKIEC